MTSKLCPLIQKECLGHGCEFYTHIVGKHPQTGADLDHWDCSIKWLPILLVESARQTQNVGAAVDSMRNEVIVRQEKLQAHIEQPRLTERDVRLIEGE